MTLKAKWLSGFVALSLCACQSSINTPPASPVLSISPDSGKATLSIPTTFRLSLRNGQYPKSYSVQWTMDGNKKRILNADTLLYAFGSVGLHTVHASLFDTSGNTILSAATTSQFDTEVTVLIQTTGQVGIGKPMTYTAVFADQHVPISLHWTFNDGIVLDTSATTISHTFNGPIIQQTSVTLFYGSSPIGSASHVDSLALNLSMISGFHHATITFVGQHQMSENTQGLPCGPPAITDWWQEYSIVVRDTMNWNGDNLTGSIMKAHFTSDIQRCDTAQASQGWSSGSCATPCNNAPYDKSGMQGQGSASIIVTQLALLSYSLDSVVYEIDGINTQSHVKFSAHELDQCCTCPGGHGGNTDDSYSGTVWTGQPTPSLRLVLRK